MAGFLTKMARGLGRVKNLGLLGSSSRMFGVFGGTGGAADFNALVKEGYKKNGMLRRVVDEIANGASQVPFVVIGTGDDQEPIDSHPLADLLARPNKMQGGVEFFGLLYRILLLAGEVFVLRIDVGGTPHSLRILQPNKMKIDYHKTTGLPTRYEYTEGNGSKSVYEADPITGESVIKHIKEVDPANPNRGVSRFSAVFSNIGLHNAIVAHTSALVENGGMPSGILTLDTKDENGRARPISAEKRKEIETGFDERFTKGTKKGGVAVFGSGMKFERLGLGPKDMEFTKALDASDSAVAVVAGVPGQLVGIQGAQTYANVREARLALYQETIIPLAERVLSDLNEFLVLAFTGPRRRPDVAIEYDWDDVPAMAAQRQAVVENVTKLVEAGIISPDEARERIGGYDSIDGGAGAIPLINNSRIPITDAHMDLPSENDPVGDDDDPNNQGA